MRGALLGRCLFFSEISGFFGKKLKFLGRMRSFPASVGTGTERRQVMTQPYLASVGTLSPREVYTSVTAGGGKLRPYRK